MTGALDQLAVLDFTRVLAGPLSTMLLGDLGATITKVERPGTGDDTRGWGPPFDVFGESTYFLSVNRNKRSLTLDLNDPADLAEAQRLAAGADVLVENFRPGVMDRLGLDYGRLASLNPALVYCSITGFGTGAGARLPGYDLLIQGVGGLMSVTGESEGRPQKVGVALVDVIAGLYATVGILAALRHRDATGEGQLVEVNLLSALLAGLANQASAFTVAGVVGSRMGNQHPSIAPYEVFRTGDGDLVIAVGNDRQFASLCEVVGDLEMGRDARFSTNTDRVANRAELRHRLETLLQARSGDQWAGALTEVGVPAGPVNDIAAAFRLADAFALDPWVELDRPDGSKLRLPSNPIRLSATPVTYRSTPPLLGSAGPPS